MQITLRKAHKLRKEIEVLLSSSIPTVSVVLDALDPTHSANPAGVLFKGLSTLEDVEIPRFESLSLILTRLRVAIGKQNEASRAGIPGILAECAHIDRQIKYWTRILEAPQPFSDASLSNRLARLAKTSEADERIYGAPETTIAASVVGDALRLTALDRKVALKRRREELEDARLSSNATDTVEIADGDAEFLRELRLL